MSVESSSLPPSHMVPDHGVFPRSYSVETAVRGIPVVSVMEYPLGVGSVILQSAPFCCSQWMKFAYPFLFATY